MALKPGDTLFNGQYRILRQLGRGGFGFVYQAHDSLLDEHVAVKELIPALVGDEAMLRRFLAEAKSTMRLTHKRIVRTYAVFQDGDNYYIVMELMPGGSLEARLKETGALPVDEAVRIAAEVAEGLACAHEEGVVHCDLKPANILFDKKGAAKVADFGIAHVSGEMLTRSWYTPAGFVAGTLPYMSPEQVDGVRDDPQVDVYALGAVLYRMLTGRTYLDFDERETPAAQAQNVLRIQNQAPAPPSAHNPQVPPWLDRVVQKALAKQPAQRYPSAADLRAALLQQERAPVAVPPPQAVAPQAPAKQPEARPAPAPAGSFPPRVARTGRPTALPPSFWPMALGAVALLVALVIGLVALLGGGGSREATPTTTPAAVAHVTNTDTPTTPPPTDTPPLPTDTPAPTLTPEPPTDTPVPPTNTPKPTASLVPLTSTPKPTATRVPPTRTPQPATPKPLAGVGRIAFVSARDGNDEIYVMNADGSRLTRLTNNPAGDVWPDWSPDGRRIAFSSDRDGNGEIYLMNADGSGVTPLTNHPDYDGMHIWSPDGQRIAFFSDRDGNGEIYIVNADGSGVTRLTSNPAHDNGPRWSPDGRRIAFQSWRDGNSEIYIMNADGSGVTRLTNDPGLEADLVWSPDGRRIAFVSDRAGNEEIYVMNADGSGVTRLTNNPADDFSPAWSPR